jgi:hypothetical protein
MKQPVQTPTECPVCGASVPKGAKACRECGADERSGWNEDMTIYDGIDIPEDEFLDDPAEQRAKRERTKAMVGIVTALVLLATFLYLVLGIHW